MSVSVDKLIDEVMKGASPMSLLDTIAEGMAKEFMRSLPNRTEAVQESVRDAVNCDIVYADPMDLTKMLNISPGTQVLAGVGESLKLFYPA